MATDRCDLLTVLKKELQFLEEGGYRETTRAPWRPQFIFQDSPTCLNFDPSHTPKPCSECAVLEVVPEHLRAQKIPCRYIPIAGDGRSIDWFYRNGTQQELELVFSNWLRNTIALLEREEIARQHPGKTPEIHVKATFGQRG